MIKLCGAQLLPLRGHRETVVEDHPDENHGNFLAILDTIAVFDDSVKEVRNRVKKQQQAKKRSHHGTLHSKMIQEEILDIIGDTILKSIVDDVKDSGC